MLHILCDMLARMMNICEKKPSCKISVCNPTPTWSLSSTMLVYRNHPTATPPSTSLAYRHRRPVTRYPCMDEDGSGGVSLVPHVVVVLRSHGEDLRATRLRRGGRMSRWLITRSRPWPPRSGIQLLFTWWQHLAMVGAQ